MNHLGSLTALAVAFALLFFATEKQRENFRLKSDLKAQKMSCNNRVQLVLDAIETNYGSGVFFEEDTPKTITINRFIGVVSWATIPERTEDDFDFIKGQSVIIEMPTKHVLKVPRGATGYFMKGTNY